MRQSFPGRLLQVEGMSLAVQLEAASLAVGGRLLVADLSLTVEAGAFACIIGPSGSGKSTLLSMVSGLARPTGGSVRVGGAEVRGMDPHIQLVFQNGGVFPWLSVRENVEFGLRVMGVRGDVRRGEVEGYLRLVGLDHVAEARMHQLSGGMVQRVAIARALVLQPQVLLMDEPFSALDAITRAGLQVELLRLWQETGVTVIFVTHNLRESILLADDIHLLSSYPGRIEASWKVTVPRAEREHHPELRNLEFELGRRLQVAHVDILAGQRSASA
ncbi:MAG: ABC transporter ATP-binding protein [Candidatus Dormibacteria bacterium]